VLKVDHKLQLRPLLHRKLGWPRAKLSRPVFSALFRLHLPTFFTASESRSFDTLNLSAEY
jgi:hypothetical protein